jgi:poly-gamma-glutamate capsule biosynthesis protein CapA/YwtB (metallophosphatase superfamily)
MSGLSALLLSAILGAIPAPGGAFAASRFLPADTIENFDDGSVTLRSFPGEDAQPDSWNLDSVNTFHNSRFALKLFGNTWKRESIPARTLDTGTVWQVAAYVESLGEIQGFGVRDSAHTLFYAFAGTELLNTDTWATVYQGAFPVQTWNTYQLPVAQDWLIRFGYLPVIREMVFVNDRDTDLHAAVYFDEILDITGDLPIAPEVEVWHTPDTVFRNADGRRNVTVHFHSRVTDPDSPEHDFFWYFGDGGTSQDSAPSHTYVIEDDHEYTVLLEVADAEGMRGRAVCDVTVDPGPTTFPVRMNFTGDIMLARRYDTPGGLIDTLGVNGIFEPTRPWLGDAADITVANLECPLTSQGVRHPTKPIVFRGKPRNCAGLGYAGVDVVSQASNHVIDYGLEGLRETQDSLRAYGISFSGAGANSYEAFQAVFRQQAGVNVAFLASCNRTGQYDNYQPYLDAGFNKPGFALLDSYHLAQSINQMRGLADIVVVEAHSGIEYSTVPPKGGKSETRNPKLETMEDEFYSPWDVEPDLHDIALRHEAIDLGADIVVNHHPHILQGFEVYRGRLIAHSLGDFAFDLDYPETYPSVILNGAIDRTGFYDFSLTPVYIDDYIPRRATGELGEHILDYLARRSRDLGTVLAVKKDSTTAQVVLDTLAMRRVHVVHSDTLDLHPDAGFWTSPPHRLARTGSVSAIRAIGPEQHSWQFRLGRDVIWSGNFEDEGSTLWLLNQTGEGYDTVAYRGQRSMRQKRPVLTSQMITNLEELIPCYSDSLSYSLYGLLRTENARNAGIVARFYDARPGSLLGSANLDTEVTGTQDWTFFDREFVPASGTNYFDICLYSRGPLAGDTGRTWFDDAGIVEWGAWQSFSSPTAVTAPNDYYWLQVRANDSVPKAQLAYEETVLNPTPSALRTPHDALRIPQHGLGCYPNPCRSSPVISYSLAQTSRVVLKVYDVLGREVRTLEQGVRPAGVAALVWDGRDNLGRLVGSGTYLCRLRTPDAAQTVRLVLAR